jgi:type VI protein secretion system component Hcp
MHKRRKHYLIMPNTPLQEIVLGKYQANETKINDIVEQLSDQDCIVEKLIIQQNQFTDKSAETLANAIKKNHSLTTIEIHRCRLRNNQLAMFCRAVA